MYWLINVMDRRDGVNTRQIADTVFYGNMLNSALAHPGNGIINCTVPITVSGMAGKTFYATVAMLLSEKNWLQEKCANLREVCIEFAEKEYDNWLKGRYKPYMEKSGHVWTPMESIPSYLFGTENEKECLN